MTDKHFNDMTPEERLADLRKRVTDYSCMRLPGQGMGVHMGTSYLIDDLWRELQRVSTETREH